MFDYLRPNIRAMAGYTPGEQPRDSDILKLNTNENPYPPSPRVLEALRGSDECSLDQPLGNEVAS